MKKIESALLSFIKLDILPYKKIIDLTKCNAFMLFLFRLTKVFTCLIFLILSVNAYTLSTQIQDIQLLHAISHYGQPKYPENFEHFDYANPKAPKGGELKQAAIGTFDSLNLYINKGTPAAACNLLYDTLLVRSWDEPLTKYGLIAEKIELDPNNNWVAFHINPKARFHDNTPVTANDIVFSFNILREKGKTFYKSFYSNVKAVKSTSKYRVLFTFVNNTNREMPLILGQIPILPEHYWKSRDFASGGLEVPVGSGPYTIKHISVGRKISYQRNDNYWAKDLAPNRGRFNYNIITYEYFLDSTVATEALLSGVYDIKVVDDPKISHQLNTKRLAKQHLTKSKFPNKNPQTLTLTYNTRRPFLNDRKVRKAISYAFDFKWLNNNLFSNIYTRSTSLFAGSPLESSGIPNPSELKL